MTFDRCRVIVRATAALSNVTETYEWDADLEEHEEEEPIWVEKADAYYGNDYVWDEDIPQDDGDLEEQCGSLAGYAVLKDVVGFGRLDLAIVSPSDSTCGLSESVTEAHGLVKLRSDGNLTTAKSR